jgi:hypothetical protein
VCSGSAFAASPLFPAPIHITRQVHDPISGQSTVLNEYGVGNRLITVRGPLTAIADYEKGELLEIDRDAGTYSITRFEVIAKLAMRSAPPAAAKTAAARTKPSVRNATPFATKSGRAAEFFEAEIEADAAKQKVSVGVDRGIRLSREALEVLIGAAYPGTRRADHDVILSAAAGNRLPVASQSAGADAAPESYGLPLEQVVRYDIDGQQLEFRTSVMRVVNEPPPADAISIPAGARLVPSRTAAVTRELELLENPQAAPKP